MLLEIHIENFAIIERLDLQFDKGLIIFTGETGAGKSIIIDAVEAVLGGRVEPSLIRSGSERSIVEGIFQIPESTQAPLSAILSREDLAEEGEQLALSREIRSNGRSIARVNGRSVSATLLREIGEYLLDIHGQSEHLSLLRVPHHLELLDSYAISIDQVDHNPIKMNELLTAYRKTYLRLQSVQRELHSLRLAEHEAARKTDMLNYQILEIETARLKPSEEAELRQERNRLANAEGLMAAVQESLLVLDEGSPESASISDLLGTVVHTLTTFVRLDPSQSNLLVQAQAASDQLTELVGTLRDYQEGIEFNPRRLDQVEERLGLIYNLRRKYGDDIPAILEFAALARQELDKISHVAEKIAELQGEQATLFEQLAQEGQALSYRRRQAAENLQTCIETELSDLQMAGAHFQVDFSQSPDPQGLTIADGQQVAFHPFGLEQVEFLIAPNPGEGFKPLVKIASGGETSRLMLALKNVLAQADQIPTLVFDEIDQGIGGRVGMVVGKKLWNLARKHQVLCITHLPQLAVFGEQHFHVQKEISGGRTTTQVIQLKDEPRLVELAQMLGGVSDGTLHSARELLDFVNKRGIS